MNHEYNILEAMPLGEFKGELIGTVIEEHPERVFWYVNNTWFRLDEDGMKYLEENMK